MPMSNGDQESTFQRFAVYFTAPPGPVADFAARWLGWDIDAARPRPHPQIPGLPKPIEEITATPRKYGFHATLKPPFRLSRHATFDGLLASAETLAKELSPIALEGLTVSTLGHFVALVPVGDVSDVNQFAGRLVKGLDPFRAPTTIAELTRRRAAGLTEAQDALLLKWGYPYVLDQFRFHMTLSGRLGAREAETLRHVLAPHFARLLPGRVNIDAITVAGEDGEGRFHALQRLKLTG